MFSFYNCTVNIVIYLLLIRKKASSCIVPGEILVSMLSIIGFYNYSLLCTAHSVYTVF